MLESTETLVASNGDMADLTLYAYYLWIIPMAYQTETSSSNNYGRSSCPLVLVNPEEHSNTLRLHGLPLGYD